MEQKPSVAILHYSCPPILGGVELVMEAHARLYAEAGYPTKVIVGDGGKFHPKVKTVIIPELRSGGGPLGKQLKQLSNLQVPEGFEKAVTATAAKLRRALKGVDVCMMHNVVTMHFNIVLSTALAKVMAEKPGTRFIGWIHDSTFIDPAYEKFQINEYPWDLISRPMKGCTYCVISTERQEQLSKLFNIPEHKLPVIPDGVDAIEMLGLKGAVAKLYQEEELYTKDIIAITPARIVRRKNLEAGLHVVAAMKKAGKSVRWLVTGAPDPHNADAQEYFDHLCAVRKKLRVEEEVIYLGERIKERISFSNLRALYNTADVLLFLSAREGFGIPVLEAAMTGTLVVATNIPVMKELGKCEAVVTREGETPDSTATRIIAALARSPRTNFKKRIMSTYSWRKIFGDWLEPVVVSPRKVWRRRAKA